ncbi:MAG TPA: thioesterase family protein [bacterium]
MRPKLVLPDQFTFSTELRVRVNDVNYAGHLSNDRVLSILHEARVRFLKGFGFTELDVAGAGTIMTDAVLIYKSEAFHGDRLLIEVAVADLHKFGCDFFYKITNRSTEKEVARAKTGLVFFDYAARKMLPTPNKFLEVCSPPMSNEKAGSL